MNRQGTTSDRRGARRPAALAALAALAVASPAPAFATSFTVKPTQIVLKANATSALLTLRNESDAALRFQLTVFAWDQTALGEMQLQPTDDIVFFPSLLTLAPKEVRNVRIGVVTPFGASEKSYRIFVEELPSEASASPSAVHVLTKMGVPIFVQPPRLQAEGAIGDLAVKSGVFSFAIRNTGNVHFMPQAVRVQAKSAAGAVVMDEHVDGWYILAGGLRTYQLTLPPRVCAEAAAMLVDVQVGTSTLTERYDASPSACAR